MSHCSKIEETFLLTFIEYYITLMSNCTPPEFSKKVLDVFLIEGLLAIENIIIGQTQVCKDQILQIKNTDQLLIFLKYKFVQETYQIKHPETEA